MKKLLVVLLLMPGLHVCAQPAPPPGPPPGMVNPEFPGGDAAYQKYLQDSIRYPQDEKQRGISGTVYISFIVNTNGKISDAKVETGVLNGPGLDAEALRVIAAMPDWNPASYQGSAAKVSITQPVKFVLPDVAAVAVHDTTAGQVYSFAEVMPQFPGGKTAMDEYFRVNIVYPKEEMKYGKEGTVYVSFVINTDGNVDSVRLRKGVAGAPGLGEEAVRVVSAMPTWKPGTMGGRAVRVEMTMPIKYTLTGRKKKRK